MNKPFLLFRGPIETISGYGAHSRDILKSLYDINLFDIKIDSCMWGHTPKTALDDNNLFHRWIKDNIITQLSIRPDIYIQVTVGNEFQPLGKYNIGITAAVETDTLPIDWINPCNNMNRIIVPSEFSKSVVLNTHHSNVNPSKVTTQTDVLFEGVDISTYKKIDNLEKTKIVNVIDSIPNDFCFLFVGHWVNGDLGEDRKDVGMLIKTFADTFRNHKIKPGLVLKTSAATFSVKERERLKLNIQKIVTNIENPTPIYLLFGELTDHEMNLLYNHPKIKSFVTFTKGEGFGRPMLEFTMSGKPVIAPKWSGHMDFLTEEGSILLNGELKQIHQSATNQFLIPNSKWFQVDYADAMSKMTDLYENYNKYLNKSEELRIRNMEMFSLDKMTEKLKSIMKYALDEQPQVDNGLPKLIRVS
jgi:glycosyltransferase involved in cell wall biosynthesis